LEHLPSGGINLEETSISNRMRKVMILSRL
jgi:hypothetical protein